MLELFAKRSKNSKYLEGYGFQDCILIDSQIITQTHPILSFAIAFNTIDLQDLYYIFWYEFFRRIIDRRVIKN